MKVVLDTNRLCSSTTERVIIHAISRDPVDIVYINPVSRQETEPDNKDLRTREQHTGTPAAEGSWEC